MRGQPRLPTGRRGRPPCRLPHVVARVVALRRQGLSLAQISVTLNAEGVSASTGKARWTKSHVDRLLHTRHAQDLANSDDGSAGEISPGWRRVSLRVKRRTLRWQAAGVTRNEHESWRSECHP